MPAQRVSFAKVVGTPTNTHWSQVYSAGNLYAVLALSKKDVEKELSLNVVGKGIINNLEAEFFTLEEKTLASIKEAIASAVASTAEDIMINICLAYVKDHFLYLFIIGHANVVLQRGTESGTILKNATANRSIHASSGQLANSDTIVLQTQAFTTHVSHAVLHEALNQESPQDSAELLAPHIHKKEAGDAAAIIMRVQKTDVIPEPDEEKEPEEPEPLPEKEAVTEITEEETPAGSKDASEEPVLHEEPEKEELDEEPPTPQHKTILPFPLPTLGRKQLVILAVALVLALALVFSIYAAKQTRVAKQTNVEFKKIYEEAQKDYELGESLEGLNKSVAADDYLKAQKILKDNQNKFDPGSDERKQLDDLLAKVNDKLGGASSTTTISAKEVDASTSPLLTVIKETNASYAAVNDNDIFYITSKAIIKTDKTAGSNDDVYKNDSDWSAVAGIGAFGSNLYVLDRKAGVLKFVAGSDGYGKQSYFKGESPSLTSAVDMVIDGSVWILEKDGTILKYTKGEKESFSIQALPKSLNNPTRIVTSADIDTLYILDTGNSRVVKLDKNGTFKDAYATPIAGKAKAIDVNEKEKKLYLLTGDKVYALSL